MAEHEYAERLIEEVITGDPLVDAWRAFSDRFMDPTYRNDPKRVHIRDAFAAGWDAARTDREGPDPYTNLAEHGRQSDLGTHLFDPGCQFCLRLYWEDQQDREGPGDATELATAMRNADARMRDETGRNRSRTSYYWRDLANAIHDVWAAGHPDLRSGLTEQGTDLAESIEAAAALRAPVAGERGEPCRGKSDDRWLCETHEGGYFGGKFSGGPLCSMARAASPPAEDRGTDG